MKTRFLIAATCLAILSTAPASAQLLGGGGGGGLGGSLGGALGGSAGGVGGSLGSTLGGRGALDRSVDLDNGSVSTRAHGHGRSATDGRATRNGKGHSASGAANGSGNAGLSVDTLGVNDARSAAGAVQDGAGAVRDRAAATAGAALAAGSPD